METKPASTETMGLKTLKWKMWTISLNDDEGNATTTPSLEGELKGVREYPIKTPSIPGGSHER